MMEDVKGYCREMARISRAAQRAQFRQEIADALRVIAAAKAAGLPIKGVTIAGVPLELGAPQLASATAEESPSVALFRTRANPKQRVVL